MTRIIIEATNDSRIIGLGAAWTAMGMNLDLWLPQKPVYDMLAETGPDYLLLLDSRMSNSVIEAVQEFNVNVIIYGVSVPKPLEKYTKLVLIPDIVPKAIANNVEGNSLILHKAANLAQYRGGHYKESMDSDVAHVTVYENGIPTEVMRQVGGLIPLLDYKLRVCGPDRLQCAEYLGKLGQEQILTFLKSTKVNIDYNNTFMLDCAANKVFTITNHPNQLFPSFSSDSELVKLLGDFVPNEKARRNVCKKAYKKVINNHTYFQRVIEIAEKLGETEWVDIANKTYQKLRG